MPWYAVSPRDAADPRWPLPLSPAITLKADDPADALRIEPCDEPPSPAAS